MSVLSGPTRPDFLRDETLVDIFDMTVDRCGDRTALKFRGRSMSYAELATATQSVAAQLVGLGVAPTDRVGIWCDQGPLVHAAMIGVMRAGAVYVPCHRDIPRERLALVIEDAGIEILVVDKNTSNLCEGLCSKQLIIGEDLFIRDGTAVKPLLRSFAKADAPAYIIYTSGSTGRPKGVMVSHTQACHWLRSEHSALGIQERDVVYQGFSPAFDMSIEEIWTSLLAGASLVVAEGDIAKDVEAIGPLLREHAVTVLHAVPSLAALINPDLPALRLLNLGGEAVGAAIVSRWARPGLRIVNTYGPTEGTVSCTLGELTPDKPVTIGQPLPNYRIYIVDEEGCLVPRGRTGELWIGGPSVATGYVGLPALNAERFKPDPFSPPGDKAGRIYRTGDQAMIGLDGDITYLGRLDGQVKIRGYRVELGEIEKVLGAAPNVKLAAITTRTSNLDETEIIGFVVPTPGHAFDVAELRKYLRKHLNSYMIPSQLHVVDDLPRMSSGKLDRQGMMGKIAGRKVSNPNFTPREKQLADALRPFLSDIDLEPHSDFFDDLGGHSLLMARFVSSLRRYPELGHLSGT
jgi:amino acid adenylation domain-containing protein